MIVKNGGSCLRMMIKMVDVSMCSKKKKLPEVAKMFHRTFVSLLESSHQRRECHIAIVSDLPCSQGTW